MIVCSRRLFTVRHTLQISFFTGGNSFCEVTRRPENTQRELTGMLEWLACLCLRLRDQRTSLLCLSHQRISAFSPKLKSEYSVFESYADIWISSSPTYFSVYGWLSELTYSRYFFPGNLLILRADGNICHFIHRQ